jgi:cardiolipin synthase A/B
MKTALAAALMLVSTAACSGPSVKNEVDDIPAKAEVCEDCPETRALDRAADTPEQRDFLRRVNAVERALTGKPLTPGNKVELLKDGPIAHKAQLAAIREARDHVHLITYILTDGEIAQQYLDALSERSKAGCKVRLMFDSVGGRTVGAEFLAALDKAGIEVRTYGTMNPLDQEEPIRVSRRHHRKILVVDGRVAFTGGINVSDEYSKSSSGASGTTEGWRDTHVRIEGPAVAEFQKLFIESWEQDYEKLPPSKSHWPPLPHKGESLVRAVNQHGNDLVQAVTDPAIGLIQPKAASKQAIYASYIAAMAAARRRIWITQAYFIPNREFLDVLVAAAKRGVDVRVLVPSTSDIKLMVQASRYHYKPLLDAGARIFEYRGPVLHAKTAVIDGAWATVGSSNLDFRSFVHNDEANAIVMGADFGRDMEKMFLEDVGEAAEITREDWARRPWTQRLRQRLAALLKFWI